MTKQDQEIRHSGPVEEIMGTPPRSIVRWGTIIALIIFTVLLFFSWLIKYPYIIRADVIITTEKPPANLMARISGRIDKLFVTDGQSVHMGEQLAIMETTASYVSVDWLIGILNGSGFSEFDSLISKMSPIKLPDEPGLGELQDQYSSFRKSYFNYFNHVRIDYYGRQKESLDVEMNEIREYIYQLKVKEKISSENLRLESDKFIRDSVLHINDVLSDSEFENSKQRYHRTKIEVIDIVLEANLMRIELASKQQLLQDITAKKEEERNNLMTILDDDIIRLRAKIDWWIQTFLLVSPIDGEVTFTKFWSENQIVNEGETVMAVVPTVEQEIIARIYLPMKGSGKVNTGNKVNIQLNGYPYLEYGMVQGLVRSRSKLPNDELYILDVELPSGLSTFYGKKLEFSHNMSGTAQIITDDIRLIERIISPLKYLINKNKS